MRSYTMERDTNMDNIGIAFHIPIDTEVLKSFVLQLDGMWQDSEPSLTQAQFPQTEGGVFLRGITTQEADVAFLSTDEIKSVEPMIGNVRAILTIDFSKNSVCRAAAKSIATQLATRLGGIVMPSE